MVARVSAKQSLTASTLALTVLLGIATLYLHALSLPKAMWDTTSFLGLQIVVGSIFLIVKFPETKKKSARI